MDDLVNLLMPQTTKDLYAKKVGEEGTERSNMMYEGGRGGRNKE